MKKFLLPFLFFVALSTASAFEVHIGGHDHCWRPHDRVVLGFDFSCGHYETRYREVTINECIEHKWVLDRIEERRDCLGFKHVEKIGHYEDVVIPARVETRQYTVWINY